HGVAEGDGVALDQVGGRAAGVAAVVGVNAALGGGDDVVEELGAARVVGGNGVGGAADGVAADRPAAVAVEDADRKIDVALNVVDDVVVDIEGPGRARLNAAEVDVLHRDVVDLEVVVAARDVVGGDNARGGID